MVDRGQIRPLLDARRFDFRTVAESHAYQETGNPTGKVVLTADWF